MIYGFVSFSICSKWNTLLVCFFVPFLEFLWVGPLEHGRIKFTIVVLFSSLVSFQNTCQLTIEYIEVHLLQTVTISKVYLIKKPLITHEFIIFEGV